MEKEDFTRAIENQIFFPSLNRAGLDMPACRLLKVEFSDCMGEYFAVRRMS